MRFLPNGLNIPDELLEARDKGNVVFLCGAGVSYPAGMPDFLELAKYVVEELGAPQDAPSRKMLSMWDNEDIPEDARPSLDQIFNLLQQKEYAPGEIIDYLIAKRLRTKPRTCVSTHETILRLSKGADGKPQIVTTNFDLLFERAAVRKLKKYVPPTLPDLANGQPLNGLVYLHGRINYRIRRGEGRQGFIISSSDFGRAYLAEGWATRFIRDLLDQYTVILLGYSANDPPVRYLLQGLHTQRRESQARLFAFDSGTEEEVQPRWRDSGVRALAYPATDDSHSALWDTLSAWADRADDPPAWRKRIVDLARTGPRNLEPYERGQVASLVRTDVGAKLFADADPPPPGEWLCVFDRNFRYGEVGIQSDESQPAFDPLIEYGLDDDPPRPPETRDWQQTNLPGDDFLSLGPTDRHTNYFTRLATGGRRWADPLPSRLSHLAQWIVKVAHDPVTPWWAAKYSNLHPRLLDKIERRVERAGDELPSLARLTWRLLIEKFHTAPDDPRLFWISTFRRIEAEGWSNGVLREFERVVAPYLTVDRHYITSYQPPDKDWLQLCLGNFIYFEVSFLDKHVDRPEISDDVLPQVYKILRRHLELAAGLLEDIGTSYWKTATFYPEDEPGEPLISDAASYLFWFRDLFDLMVKVHPGLVKADMALWPKEDPFFFNKLHLYAWTFDVMFSGNEVGDGLLSLSDKSFWEDSYRRELLHLLKRRWHELPLDKRELVERRLVNGRARYGGESEEDFEQRSASGSATVIGWLVSQGCELGGETLDVLPDLRSADPRWCPEWDETADESREGRLISIETDSDPSLIIDASLGQIIPLARRYTGRTFPEPFHHNPFDGLVEQRPVKAVAALTHAARQGAYPAEFWRSALWKWPDEARHRLSWLFGMRLARLPLGIIVELRYDVFCWLRKHLPKLAAQDQPRALSIFDALLDKLFKGGSEVTKSRISNTYTDGECQDRSRKTFDHAINSPIGDATELLLDLLSSQSPEKGSGIPPEIKSRLERLLDAPGEGADHAVCIVARQLNKFNDIDPEWVRTTIVPWFNLEHPASESAWNGFPSDRLPEPELFSLIKSDFLNAIVHVARRNRAHEFLILGCFLYQDNDAYITFEEARQVLQKTNDSGRAHSLWFLLTQSIDENHAWRRFGKLFLEKAWPKESRFQTEQTSRYLVELAVRASDFFPEVVQTILPYMVPIFQDGDALLISLVQWDDGEVDGLPTRFPDATLMLIDKIIPDNPDQVPYELDSLTETIAEARPSLRQDSRWRRLQALALHE